ncbi:tail protein [Bacillus phage 010DV004]|nr:tail protein [Bacillus phage 010DV004]QZA69394.1 tail protein [Bacillus phage 010DV005]
MADTEKRKILLRRGPEADLPTLDEGEPALTLDTGKFFVGGTAGNIQLAGQKSLDDLQSDVDTVKSDVNTAKTDIASLQEGVTNVTSDVETAKADIGTLKTDVSAAKTDITNLKSDSSTAKSDISTLKSDMSTVQTKVGTAETNISSLQSDMTTAKSDVSTLKSDMSTAKSDISTLLTDTGELKTDVSGLQDLTRFTAVGTNALATKGSLYVKNDDNLFGYLSDGNFTNLATVEQNNIAKLGDTYISTWLVGKDYVSIKAPSVSVVEQVNSDGSNISPARTMYHQGNFCNHAMFASTTGSLTLPVNVYTKLTVMDSIVSSFPQGKATGVSYTVPRAGIYTFNVTIKVTTAVTAASGYIRFALNRDRGGTVTDIDLQDVQYSNAYGTPFLSANFIYKCEAGDILTPEVKPLTEDITIGAGTKCNMYFLGDSIQS